MVGQMALYIYKWLTHTGFVMSAMLFSAQLIPGILVEECAGQGANLALQTEDYPLICWFQSLGLKIANFHISKINFCLLIFPGNLPS